MKNLLIILLCVAFCSCNHQTSCFTNAEKEIINAGTAKEPMAVLSVENYNDSVFLRQKSIDVDSKCNDLSALINRMRVTMKAEGGVGIAAAQVGIQRNIFLIVRFDKPNNPVETFINPKIVSTSADTVVFQGDGCLSIPYYWGNTIRHNWVEVEYYNEKWEKINERITGSSRPGNFAAVVFQHEFDHLQGIFFTDRIYNNELFFDDDLK